MDKWSAEAWNVVGPWVNSMANTMTDPEFGGPWVPTLDAVRVALNSVEAAWKVLQPPAQ